MGADVKILWLSRPLGPCLTDIALKADGAVAVAKSLWQAEKVIYRPFITWGPTKAPKRPTEVEQIGEEA